MFAYLIRRILYIIPISFGVTVLVFALVHMAPGDPLSAVVPPDAPEEMVQELKKAYGFDKPLPIQYATWLGRILVGDLGVSIARSRNVADELAVAVPNTFILAAGGTFKLSDEHAERALHVAAGRVEVAGRSFQAGQLVVLNRGMPVAITALEASRVMLLGGAPLDTAPDARPNQPRHMFWNFVSHSRERIERAKSDWKAGRFAKVPGETEFIPLPE